MLNPLLIFYCLPGVSERNEETVKDICLCRQLIGLIGSNLRDAKHVGFFPQCLLFVCLCLKSYASHCVCVCSAPVYFIFIVHLAVSPHAFSKPVSRSLPPLNPRTDGKVWVEEINEGFSRSLNNSGCCAHEQDIERPKCYNGAGILGSLCVKLSDAGNWWACSVKLLWLNKGNNCIGVTRSKTVFKVVIPQANLQSSRNGILSSARKGIGNWWKSLFR